MYIFEDYFPLDNEGNNALFTNSQVTSMSVDSLILLMIKW